MIFQLVMGFSFIVFLMISGLGLYFHAPIWFFPLSMALSPLLTLLLVLLAVYLGTFLDDRARSKRRAAAAARRAKGEAL